MSDCADISDDHGFCGWVVEIVDGQKVNAWVPLTAKTGRKRVLAPTAIASASRFNTSKAFDQEFEVVLGHVPR